MVRRYRKHSRGRWMENVMGLLVQSGRKKNKQLWRRFSVTKIVIILLRACFGS
jgi:hypothetical protein